MMQVRSFAPWLVAAFFICVGVHGSQAEEPRHCLVEVRFGLGGESEGALPGVLRFRPSDDESWQTAEVKAKAAEARFEVGKTWMIEAEIPGFWAPLQGINVHEPCSRRIHTMPIWPVGTLAGQLTVDGRKSGLPDELEARIRSAPRKPSDGVRSDSAPRDGPARDGPPRDGPPRDGARVIGRVACPVDKEAATWSCDVPADHLDIVFSSADLAPIHRHDLKIDAGKKRAVDPLRFRTGASVAGYVEVEDGEISTKCTARLTPMEMGPNSERARSQRSAHSVAVDERGFFQLAGLSTGTYVLEVEQAGYATQQVFPLDLFEGREIALRESIVLKRPLDIEVRVSPPLDWTGSPWQVSMMRASSQSGQFEDGSIFDEPADRMGYALVRQQPPGRYSLTVSDSVGNPFHSAWSLQIDVAADAKIEIELDLVEVDGQLSLGDEPISGEIFFGGVYGARAVRLLVDDGQFQGVLPEEGIWEVDIRGEIPNVETTVEVEVEVGPSGRAILDIELPDTQVFGRVVDSSGQIVEGATVRLSTELGTISATSDERGEFELLAVPAKVAWLSAKAESPSGRLTSESVGVSIVEGQPAGPIELRLIENHSFAGKVVGPQGPIVGAMVRLYPSTSNLAVSMKVKTDINGEFQADMPVQARRLIALISAPGHALKIVEIEVPGEGEQIQLSVPASGGVLEIFAPAEARTSWRLDVLQAGRRIGLQSLMEWSLAHGVEFGLEGDQDLHLVMPQLAAGDYRVCLYPARAEDYGPATDPPGAILEQLRARGQCFSGYLGEGGRLSYRFDTGLSEGP